MRLPDDEYYQDDVTAHTAQGDLYEDVPFGHTTVLDSGFEAVGARPRPGETGAYDAPLVTFHALGVVCSYTCGFVAQPRGTQGYSHPYRLVAPIVTLRYAVERGGGSGPGGSASRRYAASKSVSSRPLPLTFSTRPIWTRTHPTVGRRPLSSVDLGPVR